MYKYKAISVKYCFSNLVHDSVEEFVFERDIVRKRKGLRQIIIYATWCMILNNGAIKMHCKFFLKLSMYKYNNNSCKALF